MKQGRTVSMFLGIFCFWFVFASAYYSSSDNSVVLQGFHWTSWKTSPWWGVIKSKSSEIAGAGIDIIWLPPSADSLASEGYLPRKLYLQDSKYGTQEQLRDAVSSLRSKGVRVIADLVLNHRVGTKDWADFVGPEWGFDSVCRDDEWGKGQGELDTGKGFHAGRDIDHTKSYVQESVKKWLNWLRNGIGYDGWRYDFARGFAVKYLEIYQDATAPVFAVAEIWDDLDINNPDAHRQQLVDWMDSIKGKIKVFDFTTKGVLQHALAYNEYWRLKDYYGKPPGMIGWWPENAVTFLENHDTFPRENSGSGSNAKTWPFPSNKVMEGYAYILTHPGIPCIFWVHFFEWGLKEEITELIRLRKSLGINSSSSVQILKTSSNLYAAVIDGKLAVKIGSGQWNPGSTWRPAISGSGYAVWIKQ